MNVIPYIRYIGVLIVTGMLYWLFNSILDGLAPQLSSSDNPYYMLMHIMWAGLLLIVFIISTYKLFIEVRRREF